MQVKKKPATPRLYAVITADLVGSRRIADFRKKRDAILRTVSAAHSERGLILTPYTITVWDEFQAIMASPEVFPQAALDLRRQFYPLILRIAIGVGTVTEPRKFPINQFAGGEAFERARSAMERLKREKRSRSAALTAVESGDRMLDLAANAIYQLQDALAADLSPAQWKTVRWVAGMGSQELAAKKLKVNISTVSRTLRRAHYWEIEETSQALEEFLRERFALAR